jgi:hypothetical protein
MNFYVVTEGKTEAIVYKRWIPLINPELTSIGHLSELNQNNFYIVSAKGYPYYFDVIKNAIEDVNSVQGFSRLVVLVDSENMARQDKFNEISQYTATHGCNIEIRVVVQHFCFEAWALGNRKICQRPSDPNLLAYKRFFDVRLLDPELLPARTDLGMNRAQFAVEYLRRAINEKYRNLTYSKSRPDAVVHHKYFEQVKKRLIETGHISSFQDLLDAFI